MAIAGSLTVNILAKTNQFQKGIAAARTKLGGFKKSVSAVTTGINSFAGALTGIAIGGGFAAFARSTLDSVDSLAKVSDKLGTTTEELGKWRFAAGLAGIEANTLDTAMQRMVRRLGQAAMGTGEAVKTLQRFNLDAKELVKLDPSEQFRIIGESINSIGNQNEKLAAAMSIFDTEGVGLVNLFASNIGEAAEEFERLGLAVTRAEAAKIEEFNDAVSKLKQTIGARGRDFVIGITPAALEAVRGLEVVMDNLGLTKTKETAFESAVRERRGRTGSTFQPERLRRGAINLLGEAIADFSFDPRGILPGRQRRELRELRRGRETGSLREFREAARQRAEEIRNSSASLELQRQMLRALQEQTGVSLEPATFN